MLVGPIEGDGASALQHDDERLAGGSQGLEEFLLRSGQIEAGAVTAAEAVDVNVHLFALELRREADEGDHNIGLFGASDGLIQLGLWRRLPLERYAAAFLVAGVGVLELELVRVGVSKVEGDRRDQRRIHDRRRGGGSAGRAVKLPRAEMSASLRRLPSETILPSTSRR